MIKSKSRRRSVLRIIGKYIKEFADSKISSAEMWERVQQRLNKLGKSR